MMGVCKFFKARECERKILKKPLLMIDDESVGEGGQEAGLRGLVEIDAEALLLLEEAGADLEEVIVERVLAEEFAGLVIIIHLGGRKEGLQKGLVVEAVQLEGARGGPGVVQGDEGG